MSRHITARTKKRYPAFYGRSQTKMNTYFRMRDFPVGDARRYPIGMLFPFKVDVSFGSKKMTRKGALRINTPDAITKSANKVRTKRIWSQHGVPHTGSHRLAIEFLDNENAFNIDQFEQFFTYPVMAKLKSSHGGNGMVVIDDVDDLIAFLTNPKFQENPELFRRYFFEPKFPVTQEYRIHVSPHLVDTTVTYKLKKSRKDEDGAWQELPEQTVIRKDGVIHAVRKLKRNGAGPLDGRNFDQGDIIFSSTFTQPDNWDTMIEMAVKAIKVLGLDFGFVDVLYNEENSSFVFCESGANPGMKQNPERPTESITAQCYQQAMKFIILNKAAVTPGFESVKRTQRAQNSN